MIIQNMDNQLTIIATADAYARSDWKNISVDTIQGIAPNDNKQKDLINEKNKSTWTHCTKPNMCHHGKYFQKDHMK